MDPERPSGGGVKDELELNQLGEFGKNIPSRKPCNIMMLHGKTLERSEEGTE